MKNLLPRTKMLDEAKQVIRNKDVPEAENSKPAGHNAVVEILIFIAVFIVIEIISSIPSGVAETIDLMSNEEYITLTEQLNSGELTINEYSDAVTELGMEISGSLTLPALFLTCIATVLVIVFCRFIEKRSLSSMGLRKSGAVKEYFVGIIVGIGIFSAAVGICLVTNGLKYDGISQNINFGMIGLFFLAFLIQGMSEEIMFRGYLMVSVSRRSPIAAAVIISAVLFACAHLFNPGISVLAFVNLVLFGVFAGVYILKRGNIWGACALHSLWNFVQGNFYGIKVSGMSGLDTVMNMTSVEGKELINGGAFGLEGGLGVTIVLVIGTVIVLMTKTKPDELAEEI